MALPQSICGEIILLCGYGRNERTPDIFRSDTYTQVVGHTPVKEIFEENGLISTDVFSTYSNGVQLGENAMIVVDSENGTYEKILVPPQ